MMSATLLKDTLCTLAEKKLITELAYVSISEVIKRCPGFAKSCESLQRSCTVLLFREMEGVVERGGRWLYQVCVGSPDEVFRDQGTNSFVCHVAIAGDDLEHKSSSVDISL